MKIELEFLGVLARIANTRSMVVDLPSGTTIRDLISMVKDRWREMDEYITLSGDAVVNVIILVDGRDIGVLDGLGTRVTDGCKVTFIPVVHGG